MSIRTTAVTLARLAPTSGISRISYAPLASPGMTAFHQSEFPKDGKPLSTRTRITVEVLHDHVRHSRSGSRHGSMQRRLGKLHFFDSRFPPVNRRLPILVCPPKADLKVGTTDVL